MDIEKERADFEQENMFSDLNRDGDKYDELYMQLMWRSWLDRARRADEEQQQAIKLVIPETPDYEHRRAIEQGQEIATENEFFAARPHIDTREHRAVFDDAFSRGWRKALEQGWQDPVQPEEKRHLVTERDLLRTVYEHARSFLRYNGVDRIRASNAVDDLDEAIEDVKQLDGGLRGDV